MKLFISSVIYNRQPFEKFKNSNMCDWLPLQNLHILESFYNVNSGDTEYYSSCGDFLLDSGAFSFMNRSGSKNIDIKNYTVKYGEFVKKNNIDNFIELDIDGVFGIDVYKDCLYRLQDITGKDPLRVFHPWRGKEYFDELVKIKKRICVGSIAVKLIKQDDFYIFDYLLKKAHENNCQVHGLGVGSINTIRKYNFDSVDSASWLTSVRNGHLFRFDGHGMKKYDGSEGCENDQHIDRNFSGVLALQEWAKYSQYVDSF